MKRRAIIFGNSGVEGSELSHELRGVKGDLKKIYDFLRSDNGGAWKKDEMYCFEPNEINKSELLNIIRNENKDGTVDFWVIVFSGHGCADEFGNDYIEVIPEEIDEDCDCMLGEIVYAVGKNSRLLMITDSCRSICVINESKDRTPKIKYFSDLEKRETPYRSMCRSIYNSLVERASKPLYFIAQSCRYKEESNDNDQYGGEYIEALIECANEFLNLERYKRKFEFGHSHDIKFSFRRAHYCAKDKVAERTFDNQHPTLKGSTGIQIPFCVLP